MSYVKAETHKGWLYDTEDDLYISPRGRLASYPGAPFVGQVSEKELDLAQRAAKGVVVEKTKAKEEVVDKNITMTLIKSVTVGEVTVNWWSVT